MGKGYAGFTSNRTEIVETLNAEIPDYIRVHKQGGKIMVTRSSRA
jgi:hypothetical protein